MNLKSRSGVFAALSFTAALTLTACSGGVDTSKLEPKVTVEAKETEVPETPDEPAVPDDDVPDEPAVPDEPSGVTIPSGDAVTDFTVPSWAEDVNLLGDYLGSASGSIIQVDIYQVALGEAIADALWVDPDTEEPVMKKGDTVVAMNFIATNIGDEVYPFSNLFVDPMLAYDASDSFLGAMTDYNADWLEQLGLNYRPYQLGDGPQPSYPLAPGESAAIGLIFQHETGAATIDFSAIPIGDDDELDFDSPLRIEFSANVEVQ